MRKEHKTETKVDLMVPVTPESIVPVESSDCFGQEWQPRAQECSICSDETLCGIVFSEKVKDKKLTFETQNGPLLDSVDWKSVDMVRIEKLVKKYQDEGEPMTFQELQDVIAGQANTKDEEAVIQFIKRELPLTKIFLKEGVCLVR
jgi:uncharacterized protein YqfB (UPF0267 family)